MDTCNDRSMTGLQDLARKLRQERLFVRSEQEAIHQLNKLIRLRSEQLSHVFWTTRQHHLNLTHFVTNSSQGVPTACSQRAAGLDNVKFVDGYKGLGYQESMYANFLLAFRSNPTLAAACLAYGEKLGLESTTKVVQSVVLGIYGNSIISGDHKHLLELMETLLLLQLANEDQPRRILHKGNAAFCIVYKLFTESLLAGRLFLTSALHKPVMQVLMEDELYLERDSKKFVSDCFSQIDIEKKFGNRADPEFENRVKKHLQWTEDRFFEICQSFIDSLHAAMFCFPQSMGWVIARAYHIVKEAGVISHFEARALCADLMLQMFISPAIVNPELYGVTGDAPISELTRFNLMQIAQTLQVLALTDENDQTENSFYGRFKKNCMSSLLDAVISTWLTDGVPSAATSEHGFKECSVFLTCTQLAQLIQLLKDIQLNVSLVKNNCFVQHADVRGVDQSSLAEVLNYLPDNAPLVLVQALPRRDAASSTGRLLQSEHLAPDIDAANLSEHRNSTGSSGSGGHPSPLVSRANDVLRSPSAASSKKLFSKSIKYPLGDDSKPQVSTDTPEVVLVISLTGVSGASSDPPGMLSENEVLEIQACEDNNAELISESDMATPDPSNLNDADSGRMDKRPTFSHYSTDLSELGEARLEAMSSASGSSMDDMDRVESVPADDTSSFRGTSSHGNQDEDLEMEEGDLESAPHTNNDEALKALERKLPTSRESIEDKMRKFEIRSQLGVRFGGAVIAGLPSDDDDNEETGHLGSTGNCMDTRSETWSTDVYASDSEAANEQSDRLQEISENPGHGQMRSNSSGPYLSLLPRDEDCRSDVWSVEVLPGDSEPSDVKSEDRLQELESESNVGQEDPIDQLEDNRSRASTPGLSAASGVSGLSLVSDNIHAKGGEEHGSSSEKSFGKTPSSISPDADDMIGSHRGHSTGPHGSRQSGAGSSNSSGSGEGAALTNARLQSASSSIASRNILLDAHSPSVSGNQEDGLPKNTSAMNNVMLMKRSKSPGNLGRVSSDKNSSPSSAANNLNWLEKPAKSDEVNGHLDKLVSGTSSPLVGVPDAASTPESNTIPIHSVMMESDNTNTIKRSPYKATDTFTSDKASAFNSVPSSLARDLTAETFGVDTSVGMLSAPGNNSGNFIPQHSSVKTNGILPSSLAAPTSTFVPITSAGMYCQSPPSFHDLSAFDPLVSLSTALPEPAQMHPKLVATGNNLLNMNSMSAALVDLSSDGDRSHVSAADQQSQIPSPTPPAQGLSDKQPKNDHLGKQNSLDQDSKGIDRKKSWWKSPRLPGLSTKRKTFKMSSSLQNSKEESVTGNGDIPDGYSKPPIDDAETSLPRPLQPMSMSSPQSGMDTLGEDIMEKYMRKAASSQSSPRISRNGNAPFPSSAPLDSMPVSSNTHESSKSSLDDTIPADKTLDSQNANSSSNTDSQSTPSNMSSTASDRTVTTALQETPPNLNPPTPDKMAKAEKTDCVAVIMAEYKPNPTQLIADAQRKFRLVLATSESYPETSRFSGLLPTMGMQQLFLPGPSPSQNDKNLVQISRKSARDEILSFLKLQLAEAVSLQDHSRIAQIHETTRCIEVLDGRGCKELLQNLWRGYEQRSAYVAYLARTKQALLTVSSYLQHMFRCTERDQETCRRYLTTVCINLFLKRMDQALSSFRNQFMNATAADEKVALVRSFLSYLYGQISRDGIWENASEERVLEAERTIERSVFVFIYKLAIYPNGDGDVLRDQLFFDHIARLGDVVTTQHPALLIPEKYLNECPWLSAQAEAKSLNAYKTPRDKLAAVLRCCNTIMNLLKMADEGTVPGADDFTPVLVFVLIKANPLHLLSTVQYITSFIGDELTGEDSYWWMQFTAATEFIKTIDERK